MAAIDDGVVADAVVAASLEQRSALWRLREVIPEAQKREGGSIKHDVAVPVSTVPAFIRAATADVEAALPGVRVVAFGHLGDGNIHFNLTQPPGPTAPPSSANGSAPTASSTTGSPNSAAASAPSTASGD